MKKALYFVGVFLLTQSILNAQENALTPAPVEEENVTEITDDDIFGTLDPTTIDAAIAQVEKIEKETPLTWKDKMRIIWAYLSLKASNAKAHIGEFIYDLGDEVVVIFKDVKEKAGKAKDKIKGHICDHKEDYILGLLVGAFIVGGGVAIYFFLKKPPTPSPA